MRAAQSLAPDPRIQRAVDYIEAHFTEDISLHDLSREAGLSSGHLISLFSHFTGRTPHSYLIDRRIQRAIELLKSTETPISAIAIETGFSDQQHMTRMFSNRLRRTPASFRKNGTRA
jgi:transcriptional regulator GlxA family with amidase domain